MTRRNLITVFISFLLIALLSALCNAKHFTEAKPIIAPIATHNVFRDSFAQDWANIRQALDLEHKVRHYLVNGFELQYTPQGEITSLSWSFTAPVENGKQMIYAINRFTDDPAYTIVTSKTPPLPLVQRQTTMDDFVKLLSTKSLHAMTPNGGDGVSMHFSQTYQTLTEDNLKNMPTSYYVVLDDKVSGPVKKGDGYLMTVFSLHRESAGSMSGQYPKYYFLGGSGNISLSKSSQ